MVESNQRAVAAGVGTFLVAELTLLAIGKYKFDNVWKLIALTPAAMAAGGAAGYAFRANPVDQTGEVVQGIAVEEIDRIEEVAEFSRLEGEQLRAAQNAFITDGDEGRVIRWMSTLAKDERPLRFLIVATAEGRLEVATWLRANGYDGDTPPEGGWSDFERAVREGDANKARSWMRFEWSLNHQGLAEALTFEPPDDTDARCFDGGKSVFEWVVDEFVGCDGDFSEEEARELGREICMLCIGKAMDPGQAAALKGEIEPVIRRLQGEIDRGQLAGARLARTERALEKVRRWQRD